MNGKLTAFAAAIVLATVAGTAEAFGAGGFPPVAELGTHSVLMETAPAEALKRTVSHRTPAANSATFADASGDAGPGPDIVGVSVSSDDTGTITFRVDIPNRPTVPASLILAISVDADSNSTTGDVQANGAEYVFFAEGDMLSFGRWNGSTYDFSTLPPSLTAMWANGPTIAIAAAELGVSEKFQFWALVSDNLDDPTNVDAAPEIGQFAYELNPAPEIVGIAMPGSALLPKPGKLFSALGFKVELDNGELVAPDQRTCVLKVAGKVVKPLAGGCKWRIPATAAGKRGVLTVKLSYEGVTLAEKFPLKVSR